MAATAIVGVPYASPAANSAPLIGKMAWWQRVVGSWVCETRTNPGQGQSAQTLTSVARGSVAQGNVFHYREVSPGFEVDQYDGYSAKTRTWWEAQADSFGDATVFQSSDNRRYVQTSIPAPSEEDKSKYRETYDLGSDGTFHQTTERFANGSWAPYDSSSCKRQATKSSTLGELKTSTLTKYTFAHR